jgi:hypothetical protein
MLARLGFAASMMISTSSALGQPGSPFGEQSVVVFDSSAGVQDYRITVFQTGAATYVGRARVKTLGPVAIKVPPSTAGEIVEALERSGVFLSKPRLEPRSERNSSPNITIGYWHNGLTRALIYQEASNPELHVTVYRVIERFVPTKDFRCPFVVESSPAFGGGGDICEHSPAMRDK